MGIRPWILCRPAIHDSKLRGGRTRFVQRPTPHGGRPPPGHRGRLHSRLRLRRDLHHLLHQRRGKPVRPTDGDRNPAGQRTRSRRRRYALGSGHDFNFEILRGAGGYVCGEETTLINTIEGYRREPRIRPPYPVESGLWSRPTVINNAETLASVPFIINNGADALARRSATALIQGQR